MTPGWILAIVIPAILVGCALTGWWRVILFPFRLRSQRLSIDALGLAVSKSEDRSRVNGVLASFMGGFNTMLTAANADAWRTLCDSTPSLYRPFAHEGAATAYIPRRFFSFRGGDFEQSIVNNTPGMRYLYYVGVGFWSGLRNHSAEKASVLGRKLDPLYRYLCYDGYGFKCAFLDYGEDRHALTKLDRFDGYARRAAYQGVGRAWWFRFLDERALLIERISGLGRHAIDAASGLGLASTFVYPDQLDVAMNLGESLPAAWQPHFQLGMCFALKARSIGDPDEFEKHLGSWALGTQESVRASLSACDRIEQEVRAEMPVEPYGCWRERLTDWLIGHVEFPLACLGATESASVAGATVPA